MIIERRKGIATKREEVKKGKFAHRRPIIMVIISRRTRMEYCTITPRGTKHFSR